MRAGQYARAWPARRDDQGGGRAARGHGAERGHPADPRLVHGQPQAQPAVQIRDREPHPAAHVLAGAGQQVLQVLRVGRPRADLGQHAGAVAERDQVLRAGERAAQPHEAARVRRDALQVIPGPLERHRVLHPGPQCQRQHQPPAGGELLGPGRRDVPGADRRDDPVVRRARRPAAAAVGVDDGHPAEPAAVQVLAGGGDDVGVQVHRADLAGPAGQLGEQRRVVAGARADLEHPVARLHAELLEHERHDRWLRRRADRPAVGVQLGDHGVVGVGLPGFHPRQELVPRHRGEGRRDPLVVQRAAGAQPPHQLFPQFLRAGHVSRVRPGRPGRAARPTAAGSARPPCCAVRRPAPERGGPPSARPRSSPG